MPVNSCLKSFASGLGRQMVYAVTTTEQNLSFVLTTLSSLRWSRHRRMTVVITGNEQNAHVALRITPHNSWWWGGWREQGRHVPVLSRSRNDTNGSLWAFSLWTKTTDSGLKWSFLTFSNVQEVILITPSLRSYVRATAWHSKSSSGLGFRWGCSLLGQSPSRKKGSTMPFTRNTLILKNLMKAITFWEYKSCFFQKNQTETNLVYYLSHWELLSILERFCELLHRPVFLITGKQSEDTLRQVPMANSR